MSLRLVATRKPQPVPQYPKTFFISEPFKGPHAASSSGESCASLPAKSIFPSECLDPNLVEGHKSRDLVRARSMRCCVAAADLNAALIRRRDAGSRGTAGIVRRSPCAPPRHRLGTCTASAERVASSARLQPRGRSDPLAAGGSASENTQCRTQRICAGNNHLPPGSPAGAESFGQEAAPYPTRAAGRCCGSATEAGDGNTLLCTGCAGWANWLARAVVSGARRTC